MFKYLIIDLLIALLVQLSVYLTHRIFLYRLLFFLLQTRLKLYVP